jgi:hypothetical protein
MDHAAADLTGWWIGYAVGAVVVVLVAALVITIIVTAKRISAVAKDATRALVQARDRTEVLWEVGTTNRVAEDILESAKRARAALAHDGDGTGDGSIDDRTRRAQESEIHSLPTGPHIDPRLGA